jgi:hypothetical protein
MLTCEGLHEVFELNLQHDVHTALEIQSKVDFLCLYIFVSLSEIDFF